MEVRCALTREFTRAAYHLGNRHVALQIGDYWLRLPEDYVLRQMLVQLGANVTNIEAPFDPEPGAYGGGHHHHGDERGHRGIIHNSPRS
jgi:urease accessory protein